MSARQSNVYMLVKSVFGEGVVISISDVNAEVAKCTLDTLIYLM
jgi:hypothetical protein